MSHRLILVEGFPGVGKTTTATSIKQYLDDSNIQSKLYLEGNLEYPADYESVAYLKKEKYNHLISKYKINKETINEYINQKDDYLINYGMMIKDKNFNDNRDFLKELMSYDVYNLSVEKYSELVRNKWEAFVKNSQNEDSVYIFECCFLQNPLTTMLAYHNMDEEYINVHL